MLKMVDGTGIIGLDMVCPLGGAVSPPQPPNYDNVEMEGMGSLTLQNSLKAPLERLELIGNSMQGENPAPDNPQEIKSAGRKSKNLLIENISVFTVQDNIAYIPLPEGHETKLYTMLIQKKPGENDDVGFTCGFYDKSNMTATYSAPCLQAGNLVTGNGIVNSKIGVNHFVCFSPADSRFFDIYNVMYAEGKETTLDYEPYGYFFDVKVTGENLLSNNPNDWQIGKGISWSTYPNDAIMIYSVINSAVNVINLKSSNAYSFVNNSGEIVIKRMIERDSSGKGIKDHNIRSNKYTFVTNQNTTNIILRVEKIDGTELLSTDIEFIKIMLVEGEVNELTPYEPYTEQFVQIALNEPLRGIGEYKDTITKDGVVRKIYPPYEINLNDLRDGGYSRTNTVMFSVKVQNKTVGYASLKPSILCNILPDCGLQTGNIYNDDKECIAVGGAIVLFRVNKSRLKDISSFEAIKQSFIELMADKKMIVEYALETPVTEPLPESAQQQLQALHSENGVAHVFVDSGEVPCGIKLTYRKEI
jgi:hypothetical protein